MRVRSTVVLAAVALAVTACTGTPKPTNSPDGKPAPSASQPEAATATAAAVQLGQSADTVGAGGTGHMQITPSSIVYSKGTPNTAPTQETFAVVAYKAQAMPAVAADQAAPIDGGGWSWIAPDGQTIAQGNGEAYNVVAEGFNAGRTVQPGAYVWDAAVFDLTVAQAGGTLVYTDGQGTAYRWTMPATDTGPQVEQIRKGLPPQ